MKPLLYWLWKVLPLPGWGQWLILWWSNTKFLVGAIGIVFDDAGRVLLLKHTYRNRYPWGLPGGWVGGGETLEVAVARELKEETGFDVTILEFFHIRSGYRRPRLDIFFLCHCNGGHFQPDAEIAAMRFCPLDDLPALLPRERALIARAHARWKALNAEQLNAEGETRNAEKDTNGP